MHTHIHTHAHTCTNIVCACVCMCTGKVLVAGNSEFGGHETTYHHFRKTPSVHSHTPNHAPALLGSLCGDFSFVSDLFGPVLRWGHASRTQQHV